MAAAVALIGWWCRASAAKPKLMFLLLTLVGPIAVRNLAAIGWLSVLDGVWLGGLFTASLWLIRMVVLKISAAVEGKAGVPASSVTAPIRRAPA